MNSVDSRGQKSDPTDDVSSTETSNEPTQTAPKDSNGDRANGGDA